MSEDFTGIPEDLQEVALAYAKQLALERGITVGAALRDVGRILQGKEPIPDLKDDQALRADLIALLADIEKSDRELSAAKMTDSKDTSDLLFKIGQEYIKVGTDTMKENAAIDRQEIVSKTAIAKQNMDLAQQAREQNLDSLLADSSTKVLPMVSAAHGKAVYETEAGVSADYSDVDLPEAVWTSVAVGKLSVDQTVALVDGLAKSGVYANEVKEIPTVYGVYSKEGADDVKAPIDSDLAKEFVEAEYQQKGIEYRTPAQVYFAYLLSADAGDANVGAHVSKASERYDAALHANTQANAYASAAVNAVANIEGGAGVSRAYLDAAKSYFDAAQGLEEASAAGDEEAFEAAKGTLAEAEPKGAAGQIEDLLEEISEGETERSIALRKQIFEDPDFIAYAENRGYAEDLDFALKKLAQESRGLRETAGQSARARYRDNVISGDLDATPGQVRRARIGKLLFDRKRGDRGKLGARLTQGARGLFGKGPTEAEAAEAESADDVAVAAQAEVEEHAAWDLADKEFDEIRSGDSEEEKKVEEAPEEVAEVIETAADSEEEESESDMRDSVYRHPDDLDDSTEPDTLEELVATSKRKGLKDPATGLLLEPREEKELTDLPDRTGEALPKTRYTPIAGGSWDERKSVVGQLREQGLLSEDEYNDWLMGGNLSSPLPELLTYVSNTQRQLPSERYPSMVIDRAGGLDGYLKQLADEAAIAWSPALIDDAEDWEPVDEEAITRVTQPKEYIEKYPESAAADLAGRREKMEERKRAAEAADRKSTGQVAKHWADWATKPPTIEEPRTKRIKSAAQRAKSAALKKLLDEDRPPFLGA